MEGLRKAFMGFAGVELAARREQEAREDIKREISRRTWYTVSEAAGYLQMDVKEFRRKVVDTGDVPTHQFGERTTRIHHSDLYNYVISLRRGKGAKNFRKIFGPGL